MADFLPRGATRARRAARPRAQENPVISAEATNKDALAVRYVRALSPLALRLEQRKLAEMGLLPVGNQAERGFAGWLKERVGGRRWVVARRAARVVARYGHDVVCFSPQQYDALRAEYVRAKAHICKCEFCGAARLPLS